MELLIPLIHHGVMTDELHSHLTLGFVPGCPACEQLAHDMACCRGDARALVAVGD